MNLRPAGGVLFGCDGSGGIGVEVEDIDFEAGWDAFGWITGDGLQEVGVSVVGQPIAAGAYLFACIQVDVGKSGGESFSDGVETGERLAKETGGIVEALDV